MKLFNCLQIKVRLRFCVAMSCAILLLGSANVWAQAEKKRRTSINFEDQLVEGDVAKPDLFFITNKKQFNFGRLIKLRENFLPEMRRSSEEIQRGGAR